MKLVSKIALTTFLITCLSQSFAYDRAHKFGIGGGGGYPIPVWGNQFNDIADPKWEASAFGRYHFNSNLGIEIGTSMSKFKDTDWKFKNIDLMGLWKMTGAGSASPVLGLGAGVTDIQNYNPASAKLSLLGRLGADIDLSPSFTMGILADYQYVSKIMGDMPTNPAHVIIPKITLTWYFGGSEGDKAQEPMAPEKPKEEKIKESTSAERVSDIVGTKSSATVKKPDLTVLFDTEKADIKNEYMSKLKNIAEKMKNDSSIAGIIEGHADSTGPRAYNDKLSKRRALAVKKQLIDYGVEEARLETQGFGEDGPVATNKTKEGRAQNRRSAIYISIKERSDVM